MENEFQKKRQSIMIADQNALYAVARLAFLLIGSVKTIN